MHAYIHVAKRNNSTLLACGSDEMAKHSRDDSGSVPLLWSLPTAMPCCPPPMPLTS